MSRWGAGGISLAVLASVSCEIWVMEWAPVDGVQEPLKYWALLCSPFVLVPFALGLLAGGRDFNALVGIVSALLISVPTAMAPAVALILENPRGDDTWILAGVVVAYLTGVGGSLALGSVMIGSLMRKQIDH